LQSKKFEYDKRLKENFICFGAKFTQNSDGMELLNKLINAGFTTNYDKNEGKVTLLATKKFAELIESHNISFAPLMAEGNIFEVCSKLKEKMLKNDFEGVVLTSQGFIKKWKTGMEDESKGAPELSRVLKDPLIRSLMSKEEISFAELLYDVAKNKPKKNSKSSSGPKKEKEHLPQAYPELELQKALESALSKYDAVEVYFEKDQLKDIIQFLLQEVTKDLNATNEQQLKAVDAKVRGYIGKVYAVWKKTAKKK